MDKGDHPEPLSPQVPPCLSQNKEIQQDLNILKVWNQGLTGRGVVISILDDGIEKDHPDLWANYVSGPGIRTAS